MTLISSHLPHSRTHPYIFPYIDECVFTTTYICVWVRFPLFYLWELRSFQQCYIYLLSYLNIKMEAKHTHIRKYKQKTTTQIHTHTHTYTAASICVSWSCIYKHILTTHKNLYTLSLYTQRCMRVYVCIGVYT